MRVNPAPSTRYEEEAILDQSKIYISNQTLASRQELVTPSKQCRICLESHSENPHKTLISPCKCSGSVRFIHDDCLKTWIRSSISSKPRPEQKSICENGLECEMCKEKIRFQIESNITCRSCESIKRMICLKLVLFIVVMILMVVSIQGIIFATVTVTQKKMGFGSNKKSQQFQLILAISGIIILFIFFLVGVTVFTLEYLIQYKFTVGRILRTPRIVSGGRVSNLSIVDIQ